MTPRLNTLASIVGGKVSFVGEIKPLSTFIMYRRGAEEDESLPVNQHKLPPPYDQEPVRGDMVLVKMDKNLEPTSFSLKEFKEFMKNPPKHQEDAEEEEEEEETPAKKGKGNKGKGKAKGKQPVAEEAAEPTPVVAAAEPKAKGKKGKAAAPSTAAEPKPEPEAEKAPAKTTGKRKRN